MAFFRLIFDPIPPIANLIELHVVRRCCCSNIAARLCLLENCRFLRNRKKFGPILAVECGKFWTLFPSSCLYQLRCILQMRFLRSSYSYHCEYYVVYYKGVRSSGVCSIFTYVLKYRNFETGANLYSAFIPNRVVPTLFKAPLKS